MIVSSSSAENVANIGDVLTEILLGVPAKTLIRFKCVSKHWLSLITSPGFRNSYNTRYKSLYICTSEKYILKSSRRDLFSIPFTGSPIIIHPSKSKSKSDCDVLREIAFVGDDDDDGDSVLPIYMGFGVFGTRIVLAGGCFYPEKDTSHRPYLLEIRGKLYALSSTDFQLFDFRNNVWAPLQPLPIELERRGFISTYFVLDTKIIVSHQAAGLLQYYYDVASTHGSWIPIQPGATFQSRMVVQSTASHEKCIVVDCEDDDFDKLIFMLYNNKTVVVFGVVLDEGVLDHYTLVAAIEVPDLPCLSDTDVTSFACAYLGEGKVCFALLRLKYHFHRQSLLLFTFDFAYTKSGATPLLPPTEISSRNITSDPPSSLQIVSYFGSFSVKAWGCYLFEYNYDPLSSPTTELSNFIVL